MQTNFSINPPIGMPGQRFDNGPHEVRAFPAYVAVPFGVLCEFNVQNGIRYVQPVQDSGTAGSFLPNLAGISEYDPMREQGYAAGGTIGQGSYKAGEMVPCIRRGRVWVNWDGNTGTAWPEYAAIRVKHNSDGSAGAGVFTTLAVSTTLHAEIDTAPSCLAIEAALTQNSADFSGDTMSAAVVSINLGP